jgi:hypothetical protein
VWCLQAEVTQLTCAIVTLNLACRFDWLAARVVRP